MKPPGIISTGVLLLLLGTGSPTYAQQDKPKPEGKSQQQEPKGKPDKQQPEAKGQQKGQPRRVEQGEQRGLWQQHRARSWQSEHRTWKQRGGYHGYRIPIARFRGYFGPGHYFRIYNAPVVIVGRYPRFQYAGYWFELVDPWPESWSDNWYQDDDVYVDYYGDGYYLYNRRQPSVRIAVTVYLN